MADGAGRTLLPVRDVLGHESVQQPTFRAGSQLLRPGLAASSVQAGRLRNRRPRPATTKAWRSPAASSAPARATM